MRSIRFGLYPKFILLMVSLAVIPVGFSGFQLIALSQSGIQGAILELQTKLAEKLSQSVDQFLKTTDEKVRFTLFSLEQPMDWRQKQLLLQALLQAQEGAGEIAVLNARGAEVVRVFNPALESRSTLADHAEDAAFAGMKATGERTFELAAEAGVPKLRAYYPLKGGLGFYLSLHLTGPWQTIETERVGGTGYAVLVDKDGAPVLFPKDQGIDGPRFRQLPIVTQGIRALAVGSTEFTGPSGQAMVGAFAPVRALGGAVLILQPRSEAFALASQMKVQALVVLIAFGLLALAISYWTARQLSLPILSLTRVAESVARGDFSQVVQIESEDELKDLATTFNYMTAQLRKYHELQVDRIIAEERRTEAILFSIADGILMTDYEGRIQLANRMARSILGLSPTEDLEGRRLQDIIEAPAVRQLLEDVTAHPEESQFRELDLSTEMYRRVFRVSAQPVVQPRRGTPLGVVTALHDVTLEKELEQMKEEFVQSMTHDLRSPMASIRGFLEIMLKADTGPLTAVQRKMIESMDKASFRLLGMINNILDMAKLRSGRMDMQLMTIAPREIADRVAETLGPLAQRKNIELVVEGDPALRLQADPDLVERVFTNLVGNAIKFTPEEGKILVTVRDSGGEVKVSVEDSGHGIPPEYKDRIFERYVQVRGQRAGGTGLGLTICKMIVEMHRGRIWVESVPDHGSQFYFTLSKSLSPDGTGAADAAASAR